MSKVERSNMSIVDEVLKAQEALDKKKGAAIQELLSEKKALDEKLARLGYTLTTKKRGAPKGPRECKICGGRTEPPHNARRHKEQKTPRAFTDAELKEMGMVKV